MYYGIDVSLEETGYFTYQQRLYYFCFVQDIRVFLDIYRYYRYFMYQCGCIGYHIVKNHNQDIVSQQHVLLCYEESRFVFPVYLQNILQPTTFQKMKVRDIKEQWITKIDCVREKVRDYAYSFKHDQDIISLIYYYCGVAENSINILNEILRIDQQASIPLSLSLARPVENYVYEIVNPANYTISTRARQLVCLLQSHLIDFDHLQSLLEMQYYDVYEIIYIYARVLYPSTFFDDLLCQRLDNQKVQNYYQHIEEERQMYQEMLRILSFYVTLPKIDWINRKNMI